MMRCGLSPWIEEYYPYVEVKSWEAWKFDVGVDDTSQRLILEMEVTNMVFSSEATFL